MRRLCLALVFAGFAYGQSMPNTQPKRILTRVWPYVLANNDVWQAWASSKWHVILPTLSPPFKGYCWELQNESAWQQTLSVAAQAMHPNYNVNVPFYASMNQIPASSGGIRQIGYLWFPADRHSELKVGVAGSNGYAGAYIIIYPTESNCAYDNLSQRYITGNQLSSDNTALTLTINAPYGFHLLVDYFGYRCSSINGAPVVQVLNASSAQVFQDYLTTNFSNQWSRIGASPSFAQYGGASPASLTFQLDACGVAGGISRIRYAYEIVP